MEVYHSLVVQLIIYIYICRTVEEGGGENVEVLDLSRIYLNNWAACIARIFSITVLLGATIAYWILMANFLYNSVNFIYGKDRSLVLGTRQKYVPLKYRPDKDKTLRYVSFADNIAGWSKYPVAENVTYTEGTYEDRMKSNSRP